MDIVVFGASGGCGQLMVKQALDRGHRVTAVTRESSPWVPPHGARHLVGNVLDPDFLSTTVPDRGVILSGMGLRRASVLPWSKLLSPPNLVQSFTATLLRVLKDETQRVIWISAGGVGDSRERLSAPLKQMIQAGNVGVAYADLERAEALVAHDDRWLAVRPVTLMNGPATGLASDRDRYGLFSIIRRADVARWMIDVADGTISWPNRTVLLSST